MLLIIDGYNLLKQLHSGALTSEGERKAFITLLAQYAKKKNHRVMVVFDGGSYEWPHKEKYGAVRVIYSGYQATADDYIMRVLEERKMSDILLVSSDHELCLLASDLDVPSINALDFYQFVQEAMRKVPTVKKRSDELIQLHKKQSTLDELMHAAAQEVSIKEEDIVSDIVIPQKQDKASRRERKLLSKLKKL